MPTEWHKIMGKWKQFSGSIKQRWGDLTNDERMKINGHREVMAGTIQERFGVTKLKANKQSVGRHPERLIVSHSRGSFNVINKSTEKNKPAENQQLSAALVQMSDAELKQLFHSIGALQIDLSRLTPLLNGAEPVEAVTATLDLLKRLHDEIQSLFVIKQMKDSRSRLQEWDNEGGWVDHTPVIHLLRRVNGGKGGLVWTDIGRGHI